MFWFPVPWSSVRRWSFYRWNFWMKAADDRTDILQQFSEFDWGVLRSQSSWIYVLIQSYCCSILKWRSDGVRSRATEIWKKLKNIVFSWSLDSCWFTDLTVSQVKLRLVLYQSVFQPVLKIKWEICNILTVINHKMITICHQRSRKLFITWSLNLFFFT